MSTASLYAKALYQMDKTDLSKKIHNLRKALERRGHQKLMPSILAEYEKLSLADTRRKNRGTVTAESEEARVLLELYRRLVKTA